MTSIIIHAIAIATSTAAIHGYQPLSRRASPMSAAVTGTAKIDA